MTEAEATDIAERFKDVHRIMVKLEVVLDALLTNPLVKRWIRL